MNKESGFTLVEMMIVLSIIGVLAAVAIPTYIQYIGRSQVSEGLSVTSGLRADIVSWVWEQKIFPDDLAVANNGFIGSSANTLKGKYIQSHGVSVIANTGVITVNFDKGIIAGKNLILTPTANDIDKFQIIEWKCSGTVIEYLPNSCQ
ncbi:pilin [Psychrobacter frigidicola]|uniref:pilin n=1 Tax=Psychrobacter frigidicola TaxID=45611 RepID=UPI001919DE66|nr:pilin [Psychrobacter frigidicola]